MTQVREKWTSLPLSWSFLKARTIKTSDGPIHLRFPSVSSRKLNKDLFLSFDCRKELVDCWEWPLTSLAAAARIFFLSGTVTCCQRFFTFQMDLLSNTVLSIAVIQESSGTNCASSFCSQHTAKTKPTEFHESKYAQFASWEEPQQNGSCFQGGWAFEMGMFTTVLILSDTTWEWIKHTRKAIRSFKKACLALQVKLNTLPSMRSCGSKYPFKYCL